MGYDDARPLHYKLDFEPDIARSAFRGSAEITIQCERAVRIIEMDCAELAVSSCMVRRIQDGAAKDVHRGRKDGIGADPATRQGEYVTIPPKDVTTDAKRERLVIRMPRGRSLAGRALVRVTFEGVLNDRLLGFYRSSYQSGAGTKYIATTQFEAADARRAFPCWDRPDAKATFEISIPTHERGHTAVSNMPVVRVAKHGRGSPVRTFHFAVTPPMSTYLVYLGAGEFTYVREPTSRAGVKGGGRQTRRVRKDGKSRVEIRVITTKSVERRLARFAISYARMLLDRYEAYFGIRYPLPKLDLVAIPDFAAGAMENWGAITFRENLLLYDPKRSSTRTKQLIAEVISHELAHQWFGNLVTMKWWNDLWLNESFATFMATKLLDQIHPEWDLWKQFLTDAMRTGMDLDSLNSTHPVDVPVKSPGQIREIFDAISYDKGGCILRMLEHYVGEGAFRRGLAAYLKKFMYKNASGADLWNSVERASGKPASGMMRSWLGTAGFPAVRLSANPDGATLSARQERHTYLKPARRGAQSGEVWPIPLSLRPAGAKRATNVLLSGRSCTVPAMRGSKRVDGRAGSTVVANPSRTGFYRVWYDDGMLSEMQDLAGSGMMDAHDLWGLQDDLFAMCVSGKAPVSRYMKLLDAYGRVDDPIVLSDAASNLRRLTLLASGLGGAPLREIAAYSARFHRKIYENIAGWLPKRGESHAASLLRGPVVSLLGRVGDPDVAPRCSELYEGLRTRIDGDGGRPVADAEARPDLIEPACTAVAWTRGSRRSSDLTYRSLVALHNAADTTEQKMRFLGAMCGFQRPDLLARTLRFALSGSVRSQNFFLPVVRVAENPYGRGVLWPWVRDNWTRISRKVGHGNPLLGRVISSLANVCDASDIPAVRRFFADNPVPGTERTLLQTVERIRIAHGMRKRMRAEFDAVGNGA